MQQPLLTAFLCMKKVHLVRTPISILVSLSLNPSSILSQSWRLRKLLILWNCFLTVNKTEINLTLKGGDYSKIPNFLSGHWKGPRSYFDPQRFLALIAALYMIMSVCRSVCVQRVLTIIKMLKQDTMHRNICISVRIQNWKHKLNI